MTPRLSIRFGHFAQKGDASRRPNPAHQPVERLDEQQEPFAGLQAAERTPPRGVPRRHAPRAAPRLLARGPVRETRSAHTKERSGMV